MSETAQLTEALKRSLRARGYTYRDVAEALNLSESSVKRLFSEQTFSVKRLEEVCHFLGLSMLDLARLAAADSGERKHQLSDEQEQALAADTTLLSFFYLLLIGWRPGRIAKRLALDTARRQRCLGRLSRLGLIEFLPRNRVRLLTDTRIQWRPDGPVRRRFESGVKREFVDYAFNGDDELVEVQNGELSDASIQVLLRKIKKLNDEFAELVELDWHLPHEEKRGFGLLLGARPWTFWNALAQASAKDDG